MDYLDTSLVISLIAPEPSTTAAQEWLATAADDGLAISDWVVTEVAPALSLIERAGRLVAEGRARAWSNLQQLMAADLTVLPVSRQAFHIAAEMAGRASLGLRAGDALHLAVAAEFGARVVTRDVGQAQAARALGQPTHLLTIESA